MSTETELLSNSQYLSSSHSSLNQPKKSSSEISKTYKHASQLFLTRRLSEAYEALQPIIKPPNGTSSQPRDDEDVPLRAPIATASTSQRIKVWSLYVTLLNSIVDLGSEDGKHEIGQRDYRDILKRVQNGEIWDQIVQDGYQGREGAVDAEVVYNLATLLLGQAQTQSLNQERLESYLSSVSSLPDLDLSTSLNDSLSSTRPAHINGTSTPKDLASRIKILELFTLHVLPRNEEWDYARSFITNSDILDAERKEAFLQTLEELQELKDNEETLDEDALESETDEQTNPLENHVNGTHKGHKRSSSEVDYGIEKSHPKDHHTPSPNPSTSTSTQPQPPMTTLPPKPEPSVPATRSHLSPPAQTPRRPTRKPKVQSQNAVFAQVRQLFNTLSNLARNIAGSITANPGTIFRVLLFLLVFLMAFSRQQIRDRTKRIMETGWNKLRGTVGMGVKVSYI